MECRLDLIAVLLLNSDRVRNGVKAIGSVHYATFQAEGASMKPTRSWSWIQERAGADLSVLGLVEIRRRDDWRERVWLSCSWSGTVALCLRLVTDRLKHMRPTRPHLQSRGVWHRWFTHILSIDCCFISYLLLSKARHTPLPSSVEYISGHVPLIADPVCSRICLNFMNSFVVMIL